MKDELDPYYTALHCSHEGFPVQPLVHGTYVGEDAYASSDPIFNDGRWNGQFAGCPVLLPTGTVSGTLALQIAKPCRQHSFNGFPALFQLQNQYGTAPDTCWIEDVQQWTLFYECPDEFTVPGTVIIAPGVTVYGNGASVIISRRPTTSLLQIAYGTCLTRDSLVLAPDWIVSKAVGTKLLADIAQWRLDDAELQILAA